MLFILAWLLWVYHQPEPGQDGQDETERIGESEIENLIADSLNADEAVKEKIDDHKRFIVEDEITEQACAPQEEQVNLDELGWDFATSEIKEAMLLKQQSVQADLGTSACVVASSGDTNGFVAAEEPYIETRHANLASQPSIKRGRAKLYSPNSSFTPIKRTSQEHELGADISSNGEGRREDAAHHEISSLSVQVEQHDSEENVPSYEVSCYGGTLKPSPLQIKFGAGHVVDDHAQDGGDDDLEDSEVAQAFQENEEEEEDMQYTLPHGTKVTISHEAAGRIHSIVVKDKKKQPQPKQTKPSRIRVASPRMRTTSPRVRAENVSPTIVSMEQRGVTSKDDDLVHLVVNTSQMDVNRSTREHVVVEEEIVAPPTPVSMVESGNPDFMKQQNFQKGQGKPQKNVGKLPPHQVKRKDPTLLEKQTRAPTDFDAIMNRRKKFVDTMDDAGRLLGQIAHRDEKISGGRKILSKHWMKIKEAVRRRQYLNFKEKPMR